MKLTKLFAILALAVSTSAFAQTAPVTSAPDKSGLRCFDITTFPTRQHTNGDKIYQIPVCQATCPNVTPYTRPQCIDYDHVFPERKLPGDPKVLP